MTSEEVMISSSLKDRYRDLLPLQVPEDSGVLHDRTGFAPASGSRKRRRFAAKREKERMVELSVLGINAAWGGGTLNVPPGVSNHPVSGEQPSVAGQPQSVAKVTAANCIKKVVDVASRRRCSASDAAVAEFQVGMSASGDSGASSLWLDLRKTSLPPAGKVGTVELLNLLPPDLRRTYESELLLLKPAEEAEALVVKPFCGVKSEQYKSVISDLVGVGFVRLQEKKPRVINGIFAVPKDKNMQRLIIDGRPANAVFKDPPHVELPTPTDLASLYAPPNTKLFVCKSDMDNFYHRITMPLWLQQFFGLPAVEVGGSDGEMGLMWPVVTVLPMGWSHSVFLAQAIHERVTEDAGCDALLRIQGSSSGRKIGKIRHGQYIDDYFSLGTSAELSTAYLNKVVAACKERNIPAKDSKLIPPGRREVTVIGMDVQESGWILPAHPKFAALVDYTNKFSLRRKWQPRQVKKLLGHWAWNLLLRRPLFSILESLYKFADLPDDKESRSPSSQMRRELWTLSALSPFIQARLDRPYSSIVLCTDASLWGGGVVYSRVGEKISAELGEIAESKRAEFIRSQVWSLAIRHKWKTRRSIHILEGEALILGLKWLLRSKANFGKRIVIFLDNEALVGAIRKGRSSVREFNVICRKVMALTLAGDLFLEVYYVRSEDNPADGPSRPV